MSRRRGPRAGSGADGPGTPSNGRSGEKLNLVWLLVDSIRTYPTDADLRGKLPVMERFGRESVEFTRCVTTAPSTIMSVTAMMTGLPAYYLAPNYDRFRFEERSCPALSSELKACGYQHHAFLRGFETREKFKNLLDMAPRRFWPDDLGHGGKWRNEDLNRVLENVLEEGVRQPAFLFFHYNPKTRSGTRETLEDPAVSDRVEHALSALRGAGFTDENTVFVLCSDHGFPDPTTGMTSEWEARHRLSHDLVLTDDNVLIPLSIRYPGCTPRTLDVPVSSLDLFPTLLELLDVPGREKIEASIEGESLVPLMESGDRGRYSRELFRVDSRLMFQSGRSTAVRGERFKYIRYRDDHRFATVDGINDDGEVLVDLERDPRETRNLLLAPELEEEARRALEASRREVRRTESRALEYQIGQLLRSEAGGVFDPTETPVEENARLLLLFGRDTGGLLEVGMEACRRAFPGAEIHVASSRRPAGPEDPGDTRWWPVATGEGRDALAAEADFDLLVQFVDDAGGSSDDELSGLARRIDARRRVVLDADFRAGEDRYWYYRFRSFVDALPRVVEEPGLLIAQCRRAAVVVSRRVLGRLGRWEGWRSAGAETGEDGG